MPELMGFKEKNGKLVAVVRFPQARKFTLLPKTAATAQKSEQPKEKVE